MKNYFLKKIMPITRMMEEELMEYHERELLQMQPLPVYFTRSAKGLYKRGLIELKECMINNKPFMTFKITRLGKYFLSVER